MCKLFCFELLYLIKCNYFRFIYFTNKIIWFFSYFFNFELINLAFSRQSILLFYFYILWYSFYIRYFFFSQFFRLLKFLTNNNYNGDILYFYSLLQIDYYYCWLDLKYILNLTNNNLILIFNLKLVFYPEVFLFF
jgi:hypothetical protein